MTLEEMKDKLNFELRSTLSILDLIDGVDRKYMDYKAYTDVKEEEYIEQQLILAVEIKDRLIKIFKD